MPPPDVIADRAARLVTRAAARIRRALLSLAGRHSGRPLAFLPDAAELLDRAEPALARAVRSARVLAHTQAAAATARPLPSSPAPSLVVPAMGDTDPTALPAIDRAVRVLRAKRVYAPFDFARLDSAAQAAGFTAGRQLTTDQLEALRDGLADNLAAGDTLADFRRVVAEAVDAGPLSPSAVETTYRTEMGRAVTAGQLAVAGGPGVGDQFPYLLYSATHDSRVRPEHLAMEHLGLNGTAVYRRDDPIWLRFLPPWGWNCRCHVIPIDVETAAEYGVTEARVWLRTGRPPLVPTWVSPPPFSPPDKWVPVSLAG